MTRESSTFLFLRLRAAKWIKFKPKNFAEEEVLLDSPLLSMLIHCGMNYKYFIIGLQIIEHTRSSYPIIGSFFNWDKSVNNDQNAWIENNIKRAKL